MDSGISSDISKYADDMKIDRLIRSHFDVNALQENLDRMNEWTDRWQMQVNIKKCKVFSVGGDNSQNRYTINNEALISSEYEKFLKSELALILV